MKNKKENKETLLKLAVSFIKHYPESEKIKGEINIINACYQFAISNKVKEYCQQDIVTNDKLLNTQTYFDTVFFTPRINKNQK